MNIIDRRSNPTGKSLANRQRFKERAKEALREQVSDMLRNKKLAESGSQQVTIPTKNISEPTFRHSKQGKHEYVLPGNKKYLSGDKVERPQKGSGTAGSKAASGGPGEDVFQFALDRSEFLELLFEDLELPHLVKLSLLDLETPVYARAGFSRSGSPSRMDVRRTMSNSFARRFMLKRPRFEQICETQDQIEQAAREGDRLSVDVLNLQLDELRHRQLTAPYIDPSDLRYRRWEEYPRPKTRAAMFCLMDVSGSMTEKYKDLAKRFFTFCTIF
jgi:uncharacterized protein